MRVLSLHHLTMIDVHPLALIEAAAEGGFTHCGIRLVAPRPGDPLVDVLSEPGAMAAIGRKLADTGIGLLDIEAIWLGEATDVPALRPALEAGARLGAGHVLVVGNDPDEARLVDNFQALCEIGAPLGLRIMLEFITYCSVNSLQAAASCIRDVDRPNAGLLIDTLQFFRSGAVPADLASHDPSLFSYIQLCDGRRQAPASLEERRDEARRNRLLPGQGELPVRDLLRALPSGIPLSLEAPTLALRGLDPRIQGRIAGDALRSFLSEAQRAGPLSRPDESRPS
ncbi:sugar phosphate isomerase/epimerase family protein [Chelatococcus asaccharovorans]|nr:sugar phosphate isomerase/epimerase [Chelatococcus asaccharovorans]MBS7706050.1 sugar phosphate isomerase/epimerase [Chelatococcus asaccharovorans]